MESLTEDQRLLFADAIRRSDDQPVALKKIAIFDMMNLKAREKTLKEVRLVQSIRHPNIIQYLDAFVQNNELCIAFEWAEAGDLKRQIRKANEKGMRFDERMIWRYFTQLCGAMLYLHQNRIMHRDLKPANIFLTLKGVVKVGDFGLGRFLSENTFEARSKVGTPLYMSPEVLRGENYDWKSDVWSMGCILYELAMLRSPFKAEGLDLVGLFQKISKGYYEEIPTIYSRHLRDLVKQMISLAAIDRPSVQEVWDLCRGRPSSAALQGQKQQTVSYTNNDHRSKALLTRSTRFEGTKTKFTPASKTQSRSSSSDQQLDTSHQPIPPFSQMNNSYDFIRRRQAEARMELLFEKLKILKYEIILKKSISPTHFAYDSQKPPNVSSQDRFEDMCVLSCWLLSLLEIKVFKSDESPIVITQKILLAAVKAGVQAAAHFDAPTLARGVGIEVCELLDELAVAVIVGKFCCTSPPKYPIEPIEIVESCNDSDIMDDGGSHSESGDRVGESTASIFEENDDNFPNWVVVNEELQHFELSRNDKYAMIYTDVDPVAWKFEQRRMLPKLRAVLNEKLHRHFIDCSWRVQSEQVQPQIRLIALTKAGVLSGNAQIQAIQHEQTKFLEMLESNLNKRFSRARQLHQETTARLNKSLDEVMTVQDRVNRATLELKSLQLAQIEQAAALKAASAQISDDSIVTEIRRKVRSLANESRQLGVRLQVLQDYWTHKQLHDTETGRDCSHTSK
ncbi:nek protein kinase [Plasmopara halstedii]|uniref:non-specific serine/threonine protein kinase n=1 Tax=Plasmopara halstedii TaxID=4781 RepID=A0A0P1ACH4_PLAHL|nr:nek protein kinase [Plasmopara halstedii]CEG37917.1 nek protein kinase [Plasmopara halstedii]|eukprot:XP_024574286.1 nek protein kinase [Plasmopara halstedii]